MVLLLTSSRFNILLSYSSLQPKTFLPSTNHSFSVEPRRFALSIHLLPTSYKNINANFMTADRRHVVFYVDQWIVTNSCSNYARCLTSAWPFFLYECLLSSSWCTNDQEESEEARKAGWTGNERKRATVNTRETKNKQRGKSIRSKGEVFFLFPFPSSSSFSLYLSPPSHDLSVLRTPT